MCFSPTASFVSSAVIGSIGVATIRKARVPRAMLMAATPLLFATQQLIEGLIWLKVGHVHSSADRISVPDSSLPYFYCFFAFILWPIYSPMAAAILEKDSHRKPWYYLFVSIGLMVSLYFIYELWTYPLLTSVINHHIEYQMSNPIPTPVIILYCVASVASCFFSSYKWIIHYGWTLLVSLIVSYIAYAQSFASEWCFFAAILSVLLYVQFSRSAKNLTANSKGK